MNAAAVLLVLASIATSCAFKHKVTAVTSEGASAAPAHLRDGTLRQIQLEWDGQRSPVILDAPSFAQATPNLWIVSKPVSVSVHAPDDLKVKIEFHLDPQELADAKVVASVTAGEDLTGRKQGVWSIENHLTENGVAIVFHVLDMHTLFRDDLEQRVTLTMALESPKGIVRTVVIHLTTPPSELKIVQSDFVLGLPPEKAKVASQFRTLRSQAESRELVERIQVRNDSFDPVRITVPFKSHGRFSVRKTHYWVEEGPKPDPHTTPHLQKSEAEKADYEYDFFLYRLSEDLPRNWTGYSQKELDFIGLNPGESMDFGFYILESALTQIKRVPSSRPKVESLSTGTQAVCPYHMIKAPPKEREGYCDSVNVFWHYPPEVVELCKKSIQLMAPCLASEFKDQTACKQAALTDDELNLHKLTHPNGGVPTPIWFSCLKGITGPDGKSLAGWEVGWNWDTNFEFFRVGYDTLPVNVDWTDGEVALQVQFENGVGIHGNESRKVSLIPSGYRIRD